MDDDGPDDGGGKEVMCSVEDFEKINEALGPFTLHNIMFDRSARVLVLVLDNGSDVTLVRLPRGKVNDASERSLLLRTMSRDVIGLDGDTKDGGREEHDGDRFSDAY